MRRSHRLSRRRMLTAMTAAAAAPLFVPRRMFGADAPSNQVRVGCIGVGRMGTIDMKQLMSQGMDRNVRVVAVCDVDAHRAAAAKRVVEETYAKGLQGEAYDGCATFGDYRELLARKDIDAVLCVLPDPWHAPVAIAAANAGKDIYLEKPLTYTVPEGRSLVEAVRKNNRVLQTGSQQRTDARFRKTCELVRNGRLGKIRNVICNLPPDSGKGDPTPMPVPAHLDYDMWLGPTPEMPYTRDRVHPQEGYGRPGWLQIQQYCYGMITGWGAHMCDIMQWGLGMDETGPVEIKATAEFPDRGLFDVHTTMHAHGRYADGTPFEIVTGQPAGVRFVGEAGEIFVQRGKMQSSSEDLVRQKIGDDDIRLYESKSHMGNFLDCIRSRKDPICPVEVGHRSNTVCVITHVAMKTGRTLKWDPQAERFVGDDAANALLTYEKRSKWDV